MIEAECRARRWGGSWGVILPKELIDKEEIDENTELVVSVRKKRIAKSIAGLIPEWKNSTDEIKQEMKRGWK